uniref:BRISC and BRCA1-A complex member 1 n=1 Tax=Aegilops tauschii TaxID=37682 RepID=M8AMW4_AEGTA
MDHAPRHGVPPSSSSSSSSGAAAAAPPATSPEFSLPPSRLPLEDILFCVDVDAEARSEMKISKEFTSDAASSIETIRSLAATETRYAVADLTHLFKIAYEEGKRAETQGRLLRVVLIYCRSSTKPHHQWPVKPKNFTMDIVYLHDKPTADNCPQNVYDALVDALEHVSQYEGYILESGQGLARVLFRQICIILSHPLLRCMQDDLDIPKQVVKKILAIEGVQSEDGAPVSSSQ